MRTLGFVGKFATLAVAMTVVVGAETARAETKTWVGGESSLASVAANWSPEGVPASGDSIVMSGAVNMTWDLDDVTVKDWTQTDYSGTVTFETGEPNLTAQGKVQTVHGVLEGDERILKITGDLDLRTGVWTGKANPQFSLKNNQPAEAAMSSGRGIYRLIIDIGGNANIATNISVVGQGFYYAQSRWGFFNGGAGGSHGGSGYGYDCALGGTGSHRPDHCYGSIRSPVTIGSCGGDNSNLQTRPGGALRLKVGGELTLSGKLDANASDKTNNGGTTYRAVGSGGSVWVTAASIAGSGKITANGMKFTNFGPSGGGRISVCLTGENADFSNFSPSQITAFGGSRDNSTATDEHASPGTIYLETPANKADGGELRICGNVTGRELRYAGNFGTELWSGLDDTDFKFAKIYLSNNASLRVCDGIALQAKEIDGANPSYNQIRFYGGSFTQIGTTPIKNAMLAMGKATTVNSSLYIGSKATFKPNYLTTVNGDLNVTDGAKITHWGNGNSDLYGVRLKVIGDMEIDSASSINVVGQGFNSGVGPGKPGVGNCPSSHGGLTSNPNNTGVCYGDIKEPTTLSSGSSHTSGSGRIDLDIDGTLTVNGTASANGNDQVGLPTAGGSVRIKAGKLLGAGTITAIGGLSGWDITYCAGGGRISVAVRDDGAKISDFSGKIVAHGGSYSNNRSTVGGGAGTIYLRDADQDADHGTLILDNGVCPNAYKTIINSDMSDATVGRVVITNKAQLIIENNRTLTVNGDWDSTGCSPTTIGAAASGTDKAGKVVFAGSGTSTIQGTNYFMDFACTTPGKTLKFGTEATSTRIDGEMTIAGEEGNPVTLASMNPATQWLLEITGAASVNFASVSDSDASAGKAIVATDSTDGLNNLNWTFIKAIKPGAKIAWKTDAASSDWTDINNWVDDNEENRAPIETDDITIPAGCVNYPALPGASTFNQLTVASGATLNTAGFDLTVTNCLTAAGTLVFSGAETLTLGGDADFSGATMATAPAELKLTGDRVQSVNFGGLTFSKVTLANGASGATLAGGFTAKWLYCEQSDAARTYRFEAGKTFTITGELRLKGASGDSAMLTLASTTAGEKWNIASKGVAIVSGVMVSDSNAAAGNKIYACAPSSGSNCDANWVFNVPTATWTGGGKNSLFTNEANWADGKAPTASSIVYVNTTASISTGDDDDAQALTLVVESGGTLTLSGSKRLVLGDSLQLMGGSTNTFDVPIEVANDAVMFSGSILKTSANGYWDGVTAPNSSNYKRIDMAIGGGLIIEQGATITVQGMGFPGKWDKANYKSGPGCYGYQSGGYGGWGFRSDPPKASYGSVFTPMELGSGGGEGAGGGSVRLNLGGVLTLNGEIIADGSAPSWSCQSYKGSGGSIFVTCKSLVGSGTISACGGNVYNDFTGSGGRIAVHQSEASDFANWTGSIVAYGGRKSVDVQPLPLAAAGTIYLKSAGEGGRIVFDNDNASCSSYGYTDIISTNHTSEVAADFKEVTLELQRGASANLLMDLKVKDITMLSNTRLCLNGHTLAVSTRRHALGGSVVADGGHIEWQSGIMILVK